MANAWRYPALGGKSPVRAKLTNISRGSAYAALAEAAYFGATASSVVYSYTASGTATTAGLAALARGRAFSGSGSTVMAGSAALSRSRAVSGAGVVTAAGAAITLKQTATQTFIYAAAGQAIMAGTAAIARSSDYVASGVLVSSGSAGLARAKAYSANGGTAISGAAELARIKTYSTSGAVDASGLASVARSKACSGNGGLVAAGSAGLSVTRAVAGAGQLVSGASASIARTFDFVSSSGLAVTGGTADTQLARVYLWQADGNAEVMGSASLARTWVPEINWLAPLALDFSWAWTAPAGNAVNLNFSVTPRGIELSGSALTQKMAQVSQFSYSAEGGLELFGDGSTKLLRNEFLVSGTGWIWRQIVVPVARSHVSSGGIMASGAARVMRVIVGGANGAVMGSTGSASVSITHAPDAIAPVSSVSGSAASSFDFDPEAEAILLLLAA